MEPAESVHACGVAFRPCPYVDCRMNLLRPERLQPGGKKTDGGCPEMDRSDTCALDVADRGAEDYAQIGRRMGLSREMVRIIEVRAIAKIRAAWRPEHPEIPLREGYTDAKHVYNEQAAIGEFRKLRTGESNG